VCLSPLPTSPHSLAHPRAVPAPGCAAPCTTPCRVVVLSCRDGVQSEEVTKLNTGKDAGYRLLMHPSGRALVGGQAGGRAAWRFETLFGLLRLTAGLRTCWISMLANRRAAGSAPHPHPHPCLAAPCPTPAWP